MTKSHSDQSPTVRNLGRISILYVPAGWKEAGTEDVELDQRSYSLDFSPPTDALAVLSVYFRGYLVSQGSAQRFRALLAEPPHVLSQEEITSISQVLGKVADQDAFARRSIASAEINGRTALIIDGEWKISQTQFHGLMIDADDSGRDIQEVYFEAPVGSFVKYLNDVVECIRSIEWNED